ncbi:MAG TPA: ABC transporter ATP-binding protein [Limnochordia bacterium]|nr:ABC transporter ATP-binding protein [Limnochordia bacterium]
MIVVDRLTKRYGPVIGVDSLSLRVAEGEVVGLLGPNGAGKTTTIRCLAGFHAPTSGRVLIGGFDMERRPTRARRLVGYLPEWAPLYAELTVSEHLHFVADAKGVIRRSEHVAGVLRRSGLDALAGVRIARLSKGQRQRVGLAQALVGDPPVLILDEPTAGLDPKQIVEVRELIRALAAEHTILLSSHVLPEIQALCSRVIILNDGRLVADDSPSTLAQAVAHSQQLRVVIEGPAEQVAARVRALDGVLSCDEVPLDGSFAGEAAPIHAFALQAAVGGDVRRALFFSMAAAGFPILQLERIEPDLEDVFMRVTTAEAVSPGATNATHAAYETKVRARLRG